MKHAPPPISAPLKGGRIKAGGVKLYHIVACAENRMIGKNGQLPWHFSVDLKHFKETTMGSTIIMGRRTFESIGKKPLPGRENFVLSRAQQETIPNVKYFCSLEEALKHVATETAFVIGGADLFRQTMGQVDGIYLTKIARAYEGDVYYPEIPKGFKEKWKKTLQEESPKIEATFYGRTR